MRIFEEKRFDSSDDIHRCFYIVVRPDTEPKGIVQVVHGMCDHIDRYRDFMSFLADNGYVVCGNDHLGHGLTVDSNAELGYFAPERGWEMAVNDLFRLSKIMRKEYPDIPYFMIGHSMGSLLARAFAVKHPGVCSGFVFMGTSDGFEADTSALKKKGISHFKRIAPDLLAGASKKNFGKTAMTLLLSQGEAIKALRGDEGYSTLLDKLAFSKYNDRIEDVETGYEWVSRDKAVTDAFSEDPLCNFRFTVNGYINLCTVTYYVTDERWYMHLPKDVPLLLVSGTEDPVGSYGDGVMNVYNRLRDYCCDVSIKLYEGARHELLNELNKDEVYSDLLSFIRSNT
ncbi:MAG: alpha/beta fold hydrolase [Ruminococcus sp.]|nr:alpha/beta fold hydrolase [Ruminococcus sp.]